MKNWSPLQHRIYRLMKSHKIEACRVVLAVSGGADSMALLSVFNELKGPLKLQLTVAHIHHGPGPWGSSRDRAEKMVHQQVIKWSLNWVKFRSEVELRSEQELRNFRRSSLLSLTNQDWIMTAHHLQDLLETRLIRLIRGTGNQGLKAIPMKRAPWFRPFLGSSRQALREHLREKQLDFYEDPSNQETGPLRNWIRKEWLPALEAKRAGSTLSLVRSLENLARPQSLADSPVWISSTQLSRGFFNTLQDFEKQQVLAQCLYRVVGSNYSSGQIKEIIKRLDNSTIEHNFTLRNSLWEINAEQISVRKLP